MSISRPLAAFAILLSFAFTGCQSGAVDKQNVDLGVLSRNDDPAAVAAVKSFYVAPNDQPSMRNSYVVGASLGQAIADRVATDLTARGLTQAPPDMADATVVYTVHNPSSTAAAPSETGGITQGLGYADQLLSEANALQSRDNFLDADRVDLRIRVINPKTQQVIWRGSIAGVLSAGEGPQARLVDVLNSIDKLFEQYPKVK